MLTQPIIDTAVRVALAEDAPWGDVTAELAIPAELGIATRIVARESGVFAGGEVVQETFRQVDARVQVVDLVEDGSAFAAGDVLGRVVGPARGVLTGERVALNFAQRLCGVATLTSRFVTAVAHTSARVADTRKTTPGLRALEKHAVRAGGGVNHRLGLSDAVMVKDNHLAALGAFDAATTTTALRRLRERAGHTTSIIVEVDRLDQLDAVLAADITGVLLDNFTLDDLSIAVQRIAGRVVVEASGGVSLETVAAIAETGVDVISVGLLTHGARALDLGLDAD